MKKRENDKALYVSWIKTKLVPMLAVGDEDFLYFLNFIDHEKKKVKEMSSAI